MLQTWHCLLAPWWCVNIQALTVCPWILYKIKLLQIHFSGITGPLPVHCKENTSCVFVSSVHAACFQGTIWRSHGNSWLFLNSSNFSQAQNAFLTFTIVPAVIILHIHLSSPWWRAGADDKRRKASLQVKMDCLSACGIRSRSGLAGLCQDRDQGTTPRGGTSMVYGDSAEGNRTVIFIAA